MFCRSCGAKVADTDLFCQKCGRETFESTHRPQQQPESEQATVGLLFKMLAGFGVVVLSLVIIVSLTKSISPKSTDENEQLPRKAAVAYLGSFASNGESLALEMSRASVQRAGHLRKALETAEAIENRAYADYLSTQKAINTEYAGTSATDIAYVHDIFQKALAQCLAYWGDGDGGHVVEGTANLRQAITEANEIAIRLRR